jgi:hypothetical protein
MEGKFGKNLNLTLGWWAIFGVAIPVVIANRAAVASTPGTTSARTAIGAYKATPLAICTHRLRFDQLK